MSRLERDRACLAIAESQFGCISMEQAIEKGMSRSAIHRKVQARLWSPLRPGVYAVRGMPESWFRALKAATLWATPDAAISHRSAARLWGLEGFPERPLELVVVRDLRTKERGEVIRRVAALPRSDCQRLKSIPVTSVERTLIDLSAVLTADLLEETLDEALRKELIRLKALSRRLEREPGKGQKGISALRKLVQDRLEGTGVSESRLESRLFALLRDAELPLPQKQLPIRGNGGRGIRLDLAYPAIKLAIETDGYRYHSGRRSWQSDIERQSVLASQGWRVLRFSWSDVHDRPDQVIGRVVQALAIAIR